MNNIFLIVILMLVGHFPSGEAALFSPSSKHQREDLGILDNVIQRVLASLCQHERTCVNMHMAMFDMKFELNFTLQALATMSHAVKETRLELDTCKQEVTRMIKSKQLVEEKLEEVNRRNDEANKQIERLEMEQLGANRRELAQQRRATELEGELRQRDAELELLKAESLQHKKRIATLEREKKAQRVLVDNGNLWNMSLKVLCVLIVVHFGMILASNEVAILRGETYIGFVHSQLHKWGIPLTSINNTAAQVAQVGPVQTAQVVEQNVYRNGIRSRLTIVELPVEEESSNHAAEETAATSSNPVNDILSGQNDTSNPINEDEQVTMTSTTSVQDTNNVLFFNDDNRS